MQNIINSSKPKFYELKADVIDSSEGIDIYAEVPGMDIDEIKVSIVDQYLVIQGNKKKYGNYRRAKYLDNECEYGMFKKYIPVPFSKESGNMSLNIDKGVLKISINYSNRGEIIA